MKNRIWIIILGIFVLFGVSASLMSYLKKQSHEIDDLDYSLESLSDVEKDFSETNESEESIALSEEKQEVNESKENLPLVSNVEFIQQDGEIIELHNYLGKPMIINIWASWCPPCREEMPIFEEYYTEYGDEIEFIMLNATGSRVSEDSEAASDFIKEMNLNFPIVFDKDMNAQLTFGVRSLPTTIVINESGQMVEYYPGQVSNARMKQFIKKAKE